MMSDRAITVFPSPISDPSMADEGKVSPPNVEASFLNNIGIVIEEVFHN